MLHEPAKKAGPDLAAGFKSRLGIKMFIVYAIVYAGFVVINVAKPVLMEKEIVFGLNLAVVYGFGLIIFALIMALVYNYFCAAEEKKHHNSNEGGQK